MTDRRLNRWIGLCVALAAALFWALVIPAHTPSSDYGWMRPRTLPTISTAFILGLGLIHAAFPTGALDADWRKAARVGLVVAIGAGSAWGMARFGFIAAAPAFALVLMLLMGERRIFWLIAGAVGTPALIWGAATGLLGRPLP